MKLGTENKKATYALVALFVVLGYEFYSNVIAGSPGGTSSTPAPVAATQTGDSSDDPAQAARAAIQAHARDEFLPKLRDKHATKQLDPTTVDPTIHTDLLAKLDEVPAAGKGRDLFSFGKAAPELKDPEPVVKVKAWTPIGPAVVHPHVDPGPPPPPPPPPINLKYYGIVTTLANGKKTAFFMDGDEILLETEGVTFNKGKFKLVRVNDKSAVVEDVPNKHEQTIPLAEDAQA